MRMYIFTNDNLLNKLTKKLIVSNEAIAKITIKFKKSNGINFNNQSMQYFRSVNLNGNCARFML